MRRRGTGSLLTAVVWLGACGAPSEAPPPATSPATTQPAVPADLVVVPPAEGTYESMWQGLRTLDTIVKPVATHSTYEMNQALAEHDGSVPAGVVNAQTMIVGDPGGPGSWMALYTDRRLIRDDAQAVETSVADALRDALFAPELAGAAFNPYTAISRHRVFEYRVDHMYLAGLLGYLEAGQGTAGTHCDAANAAHEANQPYVALHHALLSLDAGEEWKRCEIAKLSALWEIDFPGAREMALKEAGWFTGQPEGGEDARALLERFRAEAAAAE